MKFMSTIDILAEELIDTLVDEFPGSEGPALKLLVEAVEARLGLE